MATLKVTICDEQGVVLDQLKVVIPGDDVEAQHALSELIDSNFETLMEDDDA